MGCDLRQEMTSEIATSWSLHNASLKGMSSNYSIRSGSIERERVSKQKIKEERRENGDTSSSSAGSSSCDSSSSISLQVNSLTAKEYKSLVLSHSLALIPALLLLIICLCLAIYSPCHLHALPLLKRSYSTLSLSSVQPSHIPLPSPQDSNRLSSQRCSAILNSGLTSSALVLASTSWLASYALRPFCLSISNLFFKLYSLLPIFESKNTQTQQFDQDEQEDLSSTSTISSAASTFFSVLIRTSFLELLRLGSLILSFALVRAQIPRLHGHDENGRGSLPPPGQGHSHEPWISDLDHSLQPTDIRFKLALWCSLGWATTEVLFGSYQLFQQLSLYSPSTIYPDVDTFTDEREIYQPTGPNFAADDGEDNGKENFKSNSFLPKIPFNTEILKDKYEATGSSGGLVSKEETNEDTNPNPSSSPLMSSSSSSRLPNYGSTSNTSPKKSQSNPSPNPKPTIKSPDSSTSSISLLSNPILNSNSNFNVTGIESGGDDSSIESLSPILTTLDSRIQSLLLLHKRSELEAQLGTSLSLVPVTLCGLWRIDSIIWNFALTMLAAASIVQDLGPIWSGGLGRRGRQRQHDFDINNNDFNSLASPFTPHFHDPPIFPSTSSQIPILVLLISVHSCLTTLWTISLPRLGFAIMTYSSLLIGIGLLFGAAGWWQVVV